MSPSNDRFAPSAESPSSKPNLLVLDDEESVRKLLVRLLSRGGYQIHESATIDQAYAKASELDRLDVWVTDAHVEGGDATLEVERFRAIHPHLAVVLVSGCEPDPDRLTLLNQLGVMFVAKPFTPAQLNEAIGAALRHGSATSTVVPILTEGAAVQQAR
jgi:DNA-binding response OmpR family regulator